MSWGVQGAPSAQVPSVEQADGSTAAGGESTLEIPDESAEQADASELPDPRVFPADADETEEVTRYRPEQTFDAVSGTGAKAPRAGGGFQWSWPHAAAATLAVTVVLLAVLLPGGTSPQLARRVPVDTQLYVEAPDITEAVEALVGMHAVHGGVLTPEQFAEQLTRDLAKTLGLSESAAGELLRETDAVALVGRHVTRRPQFAVLIEIDEDVLPQLHASSRLESLGEFRSGKRFAVSKGTPNQQVTGARGFLESMIESLSVLPTDRTRAFATFPEQGLVVVGDGLLVEDIGSVLDGSELSLADTDAWEQSEFRSASVVVGYAHPDVLRRAASPGLRELADQFFDEVPPLSGSFEFTEEGIVTSFTGKLQGDGIDSAALDALPEPVRFDVQRRLPAETVAYAALSMEAEALGRQRLDALARVLEVSHPEWVDVLETQIGELHSSLGVRLDRLLDAAGPTATLAVAVDQRRNGTAGAEGWRHRATFAVLIDVDDEERASEFFATLDDAFQSPQLAGLYDVSDKRGGFNAIPAKGREGVRPVFVRSDEDHLLIAAGALGERFVEALAGERSLDQVLAHERARDALAPRHQALVWVDAARLLSERELSGLGSVALDVLGPLVADTEQRESFAVGLHVTPEDPSWSFRIEAVNAPMLLGAIQGSFVATPPAPEPVAAQVAPLRAEPEPEPTQASDTVVPSAAAAPAAESAAPHAVEDVPVAGADEPPDPTSN